MRAAGLRVDLLHAERMVVLQVGRWSRGGETAASHAADCRPSVPSDTRPILCDKIDPDEDDPVPCAPLGPLGGE